MGDRFDPIIPPRQNSQNHSELSDTVRRDAAKNSDESKGNFRYRMAESAAPTIKKLRGKITMSLNVTLEHYRRAYRDTIVRREKKASATHSIACLIGNSVLIAFNSLFVPHVYGLYFHWSDCAQVLRSIIILEFVRLPDSFVKDEIVAENMAREGLGASLV